MRRVTGLAHEAVRAVVQSGERVVDATLGNGHDTLFLARLVGPDGTVYGFDVQDGAIDSARRRLEDAGVEDARLIHGDHATMGEHVEGPVAAVMFNLGYLPGGDHARTTTPSSTIAALQQALVLLRPGGVISVVCYRGHPGGAEEAEAVESWAAGLDATTLGKDRGDDGPFLVLVKRG